MEKEIRNLNEIRASVDSRKVEGYAAVYDTESLDLGGFTEVIARGAFDDVIGQSDVFATMNHDTNKILARSNHGKGSLTLSLDEKGLRYEFEAPNTEVGNELLAFLRSGDINESSFAFTVESDTWERSCDGKHKRTINKVHRLYDVSPVWNAAYGEATSVKCARYAEILEEERQANEQAMKEAEEKRQAEEEAEKQAKLDEYYKALREENKAYMVEK